MSQNTRSAKVRKFCRGCLIGLFAGVLLVTAGLLFFCRSAVYNRFVRFPQEERAWKSIQADRRVPPDLAGWKDFRGVLHSHSHLSHDCEVPFEEILRVLKQTGRDFICMSDHCDEGRADFSAQWRGLHDGVLFIPGYEMKAGFMPFGVASGTVLSNQMDPAALAEGILKAGGLLFYAHPEEPREWNRAELTGMEIYNTHADLKDEKGGLLGLMPELLVNQRRFPDQVFRTFFDRPSPNLRRWDELNLNRHLTGIGGNDCHQNTGVRILCTSSGSLRVEDTSPKTLKELPLNGLTKPIARFLLGPLSPGTVLWQLQLDPYERMVRHVTTHVLAKDLDERSILDSLKAGRAFVGFDTLADSTGFQWFAAGGSNPALMGESLPLGKELVLKSRSPHRCRFSILRNGTPVHQEEGWEVNWVPAEPGNYRVEAELQIRDEWVPWVYTNPIHLR
jgi:hypothetical protein